MMIDPPVSNTIAHRIEGQLAFEILRARRRRRQHSLRRKLPLVEVQQTEIKVQMGLGVLNLGGNPYQYLLRLILFTSTFQRNVEPVRAIDQAIVSLGQSASLIERGCGLVELAQEVMCQPQMIMAIQIFRCETCRLLEVL